MADAAKIVQHSGSPVVASTSPRRSLLDLAPLELDCMNTLWPIGEGTVREIRDRLAPRRPRAYTTIMTIMDRLARKGVVERRKSGRAYIYRPNLSADDARRQALGQVVENFFGGSSEEAVTFLRRKDLEARTAATSAVNAVEASFGSTETPSPARALAASAGASAAAAPVTLPAQQAISERARVGREESRGEEPVTMDETLL
jgi:BlaI family transcriptional regulator, penicillinase repressor